MREKENIIYKKNLHIIQFETEKVTIINLI